MVLVSCLGFESLVPHSTMHILRLNKRPISPWVGLDEAKHPVDSVYSLNCLNHILHRSRILACFAIFCLVLLYSAWLLCHRSIPSLAGYKS